MPATVPTDQAALRTVVEAALDRFLARQRDRLADIDADLAPVAAALRDFVLNGGKRLRPAFAYWGHRGAGGAHSDQLVGAVASLELLQACALIHDDVMDASDTRRGEPAVHRRFAGLHAARDWTGDPDAFGTGAAILLGDLCLGWSAEMYDASGLPPAVLAAARREYDLMRTEVMAGQYLDLLAQADVRHSSRERAGKVARYKSAKYTVERPLLLGGRLAGATPDVLAAYSAYGLPLGEAFQLRDDVLGVFGDPSSTGKPAGDDLREGKRTYLVAAAYETATPTGRALLDARLGDRALTAAGVAELRSLIIDTGALSDTESRIATLTAAALDALTGAAIEPAAAEVLTRLAAAATNRAF
ncbi:polyprenyl synthetase family protein [Actinocatenispora rupis]|uniref:polyprenyl synthetase family protein n=1 Tax=Actinocatenispora rupis TaxID=519421 RepID=UPI001EF2AA69|nr:polyprenyl synthetase family protein [Actinocatenispora rupis]